MIRCAKRSRTLITSSVIAFLACVPHARAELWNPGTANWNTVGSPGWATAVPNAVGAVAELNAATTSTTNLDIAATVGSILLSANGNISWTINPQTNVLTLDQDGAGTGSAVITNSNSNTGTTNALILAAGTAPVRSTWLTIWSSLTPAVRPTPQERFRLSALLPAREISRSSTTAARRFLRLARFAFKRREFIYGQYTGAEGNDDL